MLLRTDERCYVMGYKAVVVAAHTAGLDHQAILMDPEGYPVGHPETCEEPMVVSTDPESDCGSS